MDTKSPKIKAAIIDLSAKLDVIINSAIKEYCAETGAEVKMDIPDRSFSICRGYLFPVI